MVIIQGWFCKPKLNEKDELYKFGNALLTDSFVATARNFDLSDLVITGESRFVGNLLTIQEVFQVISLKEPFRPFYITHVAKTALEKMLNSAPTRSVIA
jgi:hypothetical protein